MVLYFLFYVVTLLSVLSLTCAQLNFQSLNATWLPYITSASVSNTALFNASALTFITPAQSVQTNSDGTAWNVTGTGLSGTCTVQTCVGSCYAVYAVDWSNTQPMDASISPGFSAASLGTNNEAGFNFQNTFTTTVSLSGTNGNQQSYNILNIPAQTTYYLVILYQQVFNYYVSQSPSMFNLTNPVYTQSASVIPPIGLNNSTPLKFCVYSSGNTHTALYGVQYGGFVYPTTNPTTAAPTTAAPTTVAPTTAAPPTTIPVTTPVPTNTTNTTNTVTASSGSTSLLWLYLIFVGIGAVLLVYAMYTVIRYYNEVYPLRQMQDMQEMPISR